MRAKKLSTLIILLFTAAFAHAATRLVPAQYPNIQAAIDDCNNGDTVIVAPGTYTGPGNREIDFKGKAITVTSTDPNDPNTVAATVIDCQNAGGGFFFHSYETSSSALAGLTITNGQQPSWPGPPGGAIRCYGSGTHPLVVNCVITGNSACMGGGVYCLNSGITLDGCIISENSASSTTGGGIHSNKSNIVLINCTITNNTTVAGGSRYGGGIYLSGGSGLISHCVIADNSAWRGGAITSSSENLQVHHSFITDNFANQYGGALYLTGGASTFNCCTIAGNSICFDKTIDAYGDHVFSNCIIRGGIEEGYTTVSYSNVEGGSPGEGNIDVDPLFVDANNGDYHLSPQSFCIDAGDPNYSPQPGETDIDGDPRLLGRRVDMGADEFSTTSPAIIVVSPTAVQFTPLFESRPDSAQTTILILNRGINKLNWRISETCPWLQADPIAGTAILEPNEVTLTVDPRGLSKGTYHCDLTISDSNASNNPVVLPVSLEIIGPILSVGASELNFQANIENPIPPDQTLSLQNTGGGTLYWEITVPDECGWLTVYPRTGRSHGDVNEVALHIDASGLPPGYYTSELTITDPNAVNNPRTVEVHLHMGLEPGWLFVPSEYPNIQSAIDWALPGDIVVVAPGTYTGPGNRDIDFLGKPITVRSIDPSAPQIVASTVIDCNGTSYGPHSGFYFHSGEDANSILSGFTITKGYGYEHTSGAILCDNSSPTVSNCTITGNGCTARSGCPSAGIQCYKSSPIISNCTISGNWSGYGGGIYCSQSNLVVTNCLFTGNSSGSGGGIYCSQSNLVVTNCLFTGNSSARGGGIYCCESNAVIDNCIFSGNSVESSGGAIYNYRGNLSLANATVTENSAKSRGGALYCDYSGKPTVNNSILYSNTAPRGPEIALDAYYSDPSLLNLAVSYSNVRGGLSAVAVEYPPRAGQTISAQGGAIVDWGPGNIEAEPYFNDPDNGDYRLKSNGWRWDVWLKNWAWDAVTSRCIDAGDPDAPLRDEPLFVPVDPTGYWGVNLRINMGAYGGTAEASIPPHGWAVRTDYNNDGVANFADFGHWSRNQTYTPTESVSDSNSSPAFSFAQFAPLVADWLDQTTWFQMPGQATSPNPPDGSVGIRLDPVLSWEPGAGATSHDVYFGTSDPPTFQASTTATTFAPGILSKNTTYYWRIDEVNHFGKTAGPVWSFTTGTGGGGR